MTTAVAQREEGREVATVEPVSETAAILSMIERAARDPSVDMDKFERLMSMRERVVAQNARGAYYAALAEMQPKLPMIEERGEIKISENKPGQRYALWEDINKAIRGVLAEHGFALSFRIAIADDKVSVTGVLSHSGGHCEETTMQLPSDKSGSKNVVQALGSSTSYGKRYTAMALLNLTSGSSEDDDGDAASGEEKISEEQATTLIDAITAIASAGNFDEKATRKNFCDALRVKAIADLPASRFEEAKKLIEQKRRAAK
jgi:hypothetical protein